MVARHGASRYFIAYRAKVPLVAREQMRHATSMGNAAVDRIAEDMDLVAQDCEKAYHDIADEDAVPTVKSRRTAPGPPPRVTDRAEETALHPFGSATPMVFRATRSGSRCSACGRFGHEQGDPECVHAPGARVLPVPRYSPDEHEDEEQAS